MQPMARVALYLRVSTTGQTVGNQRLELEAWAGRAGHEVAAVYADEGISGAKGRDRRPEFDRMLKDAVRRRFDLLAARGGPRVEDVLVAELQAAQPQEGVDLQAVGVVVGEAVELGVGEQGQHRRLRRPHPDRGGSLLADGPAVKGGVRSPGCRCRPARRPSDDS